MLLFSALLALSIHLNVSHPEVIIYSQLTSSCHATTPTTTTTTLILFPPTLNTFLFFFFFAPFFNVSPFPAPLLLLPLLLIRPSTTSVDFNYTTSELGTRNSGSSVSGVGRSVVHHGAEGAVRVQRKSIYFDGNLQRIPSHVLSQCVDVSMRMCMCLCDTLNVYKKDMV